MPSGIDPIPLVAWVAEGRAALAAGFSEGRVCRGYNGRWAAMAYLNPALRRALERVIQQARARWVGLH